MANVEPEGVPVGVGCNVENLVDLTKIAAPPRSDAHGVGARVFFRHSKDALGILIGNEERTVRADRQSIRRLQLVGGSPNRHGAEGRLSSPVEIVPEDGSGPFISDVHGAIRQRGGHVGGRIVTRIPVGGDRLLEGILLLGLYRHGQSRGQEKQQRKSGAVEQKRSAA